MKALLALLVFGSLLGQPASAAQVSAQVSGRVSVDPGTAAVWNHHLTMWTQRDLAGIVSDYGPSSIVMINGETYRGPEEIRVAFERLFKIFDDGRNEIDPAVLDGPVVFLTWHFAPAGKSAFDGTDTFVIENGVIRFQTIASRLYESASH